MGWEKEVNKVDNVDNVDKKVEDIYAARETDTLGISSEILKDKIAALGTDAYYFPTFDEIEDFLLTNCTAEDLIITMGAGDVYKIGENLLGM